MVLASTSEVYGDPKVHPQTEEYWGNVNPVGPRSVYDEAKTVCGSPDNGLPQESMASIPILSEYLILMGQG